MEDNLEEFDEDFNASEHISGLQRKLAPWVEKYRPEKVDDVSHQEEVVKALKKSIELGSIPHLLFHGPPGTGKTTTVLALARALYGPDLYRSRILELNASDERGIKVVREKIKVFAQGAVGGQKSAGYPCPRFKLIILDEADTMTPEAQSALRRIIEAYSKVTRFCLICNYVTRVIEPLASRCAKFRFKSLPVPSMKNRIREIAIAEHVELDDSTLEELLKSSNGDMRKAVTFLQSCHQLAGGERLISPAMVVDVSGQVPLTTMDKFWATIRGGSFDQVREEVQEVVYQGFPMATIIAQLHDAVASGTQDMADIDRALICEKLAEAEANLIDGASELLQLLDLAALIMRRLTNSSADVDNRSSSMH